MLVPVSQKKLKVLKMAVNILPTEVLEYIFKHLSGRDLLACRKVCVRWSEILVNLERVWRNACRQVLGEGHREARDRAGLSWAELYAPLSLWPAVNTAEVRTYKLSRSSFEQFQVLQNGIIGVPQQDQSFDEVFGCNSIVYYDLNALQECHRENFEFSFVAYRENEKFIVLIDNNAKLYVKHKISKEHFFVGKVDENKTEDFSAIECLHRHMLKHNTFDLFQNVVYFRNIDYRVYIYELKDNHGDVSAEVVHTDHLYKKIISICNVDNKLVMLGNEEDLLIYCLLKRQMVTTPLIGDPGDYVKYLQTDLEFHGFNWRSTPLFQWMITYGEDDEYFSYVSNLEVSACHAHGRVILLGTDDHILHVYFEPYDAEGILRIDDAEPIRSFDLRVMFDFEPDADLTQLDVVEIVDGHKVIVAVGDQIYVIELSHKFHDN